MTYLKHELDANYGDIVEVELRGDPANVMLLDPLNYQTYLSGGRPAYHGGHYTRSPARIRVPHSGHWYIVVDLGGGAGHVTASVRVIPAGTPAAALG